MWHPLFGLIESLSIEILRHKKVLMLISNEILIKHLITSLGLQ
jgi:hypothetical protein